MAITPQEALGKRRKNEAAAIDALEKQLSEKLAKCFDGRRAVSIALSGRDFDFIVLEVMARFEKSGWNVKRESGDDKRDGSWDNLIFSGRVNPYPQRSFLGAAASFITIRIARDEPRIPRIYAWGVLIGRFARWRENRP